MQWFLTRASNPGISPPDGKPPWKNWQILDPMLQVGFVNLRAALWVLCVIANQSRLDFSHLRLKENVKLCSLPLGPGPLRQ